MKVLVTSTVKNLTLKTANISMTVRLLNKEGQFDQ